MGRHEVCRVRESRAYHAPRSGQDFRRVRLAVIHSSGSSRVHVRVERRDNRIVEGERDIEEPVHRPREREDAISVHL